MGEMKTLTINGKKYDVVDDGSARFDAAQSLTADQQQQARGNIGSWIYQHKILFGAVSDSFYIGDWETMPMFKLVVYNRNPNEMTMQDIINGGYLDYLPTTYAWLANWNTGLDTTAFATGAYVTGDNIVIHLYYFEEGEQKYYECRYPIADCEVEDTVTEI